METLMIKSRSSLQQFLQTLNISSPLPGSAPGARAAPPEDVVSAGAGPAPGAPGAGLPAMGPRPGAGLPAMSPRPGTGLPAASRANFSLADNSTGDYFPSYWADGELAWNGSYLSNGTANITYNISDYELLNVTNSSVPYGFWFCAKWVEAQQDLFQAANLCFAVAFLVPKSFKQSILAVRALAAAGFLLLAAWAGTELCAPDALAWNVALVVVNSVHTALLIVRFLPPTLSLELTELYLRLFKPLRVSKKHFRELAREARLLRLEPGQAYALEGATPADERLSILLKGKLKVSCEQTHLHVIQPHQFVDSPEWEANHEQSDDVFQVTITAEESCMYLCWPRMRLERVLRHRPMLKVVLDSIIGKDITHKLYSLNEKQLQSAAEEESNEDKAADTRAFPRSLSADAVDVGARGRVRSLVWRAQERRGLCADRFSPARAPQPQWRPVATQFPPHSPFAGRVQAAPAPGPVPRPHAPLEAQASSASLPFPAPLLSPPRKALRKTASFRKNREVKFAEPHAAGL